MSKDMLPGGLADDDTSGVDSEQLAIGIQVEMEHTDDPAIAEEIARDHLSDDAEYYSKLQMMESKAMETDYGIIEDEDGFWVVEGDNDERVYGPYDTREEASQIMQEVEQENKSAKEVEKATVQPYEGGRWIVVGSRGQMVAGPYDTELEALQASSQISMGFGTIRSHSMNKATMITQNQDDPLTGMTAEGRPVRFSESMWVWIYDDTPGEDAVEKVENAQLIRSHQMDINDIALQFCGLISIGKKASPEIMGMLRKSLKGDDGAASIGGPD
jgi:hypothetical protein